MFAPAVIFAVTVVGDNGNDQERKKESAGKTKEGSHLKS